MYNHNKAQQSKNRVHISWDILYKSLTQAGNVIQCWPTEMGNFAKLEIRPSEVFSFSQISYPLKIFLFGLNNFWSRDLLSVKGLYLPITLISNSTIFRHSIYCPNVNIYTKLGHHWLRYCCGTCLEYSYYLSEKWFVELWYKTPVSK